MGSSIEKKIRVFLPFAFGFFLSYLYRVVNAVLAPDLASDLGVGPAELGLLTAAYFIAFASSQLPLGLLLDRFGPRRIEAALIGGPAGELDLRRWSGRARLAANGLAAELVEPWIGRGTMERMGAAGSRLDLVADLESGRAIEHDLARVAAEEARRRRAPGRRGSRRTARRAGPRRPSRAR